MDKSIMLQTIKNTFFHFPKAVIATLANAYPASRLTVIGVTGSDGKTTTVHMVHHILVKNGLKTAMISTVIAKIGNKELDTGLHVTTPDPFLLQRLLVQIKSQGFSHVVLETTSHGLDQNRLIGTNIRVAVLTNITHEHLDYHKTFDFYRKAKIKLFRSAPFAILNKDDDSYLTVKKKIPRSSKLITYGFEKGADFKVHKATMLNTSSSVEIRWKNEKITATIPVPGRYNIYNALAATAAAFCVGIKPQDSLKSLKDFPPVPGRLSKVNSHPDIYIDFAHTPFALSQMLSFLKSILTPPGRLITVFGSAGDRDRSKRPMMGSVSAQLSHISIFTADDPRFEKATDIIDEISLGAIKKGAIEISKEIIPDRQKPHVFIKEPDRQKAINLAVSIAQPNDTIAISGKGHEKSLSVRGKELPWSDFDAVKIALENK